MHTRNLMLVLFLEYVICIITALQKAEKDKQTTYITWDKLSFITQRYGNLF